MIINSTLLLTTYNVAYRIIQYCVSIVRNEIADDVNVVER
jgi:hypothetical protein